jgi:hypothetical protein
MEEKESQCSLHKQKSNKRTMAKTITRETKREGQKKAKRCIAHMNQKNGEIVPFVVGNYLTHIPSNVTYMQIV